MYGEISYIYISDLIGVMYDVDNSPVKETSPSLFALINPTRGAFNVYDCSEVRDKAA